MSAPRTKRPFAGDASQRQITTFFGPRGANDASNPSPSPDLADSSQPQLPASVQANLLSVGMRVRKSVPEGYKTGSTYGSFALWSEGVNGAGRRPASSSCDAGMYMMQPPITSINPTAGSAVVSSRRELTPFCGLMKVGGMSTQPEPEGVVFSDSVFGGSGPDINDVPGLTSSQDSASSMGSAAWGNAMGPGSANRKRGRASSVDNGGLGIQRPVDWREEFLDGEVSPRTLVAPGTPDAGPQRVMAVPRRKSKKEGLLASGGQENVVLVASGDVPEDFDEAEFLVYSEGQNFDFDFEMGGV